MALTVCFKCDKTYGERHDACPHCRCHNFFTDKDTQAEAVDYLCKDMDAEAKKRKQEKLKELAKVHWWQNPPWWMRWLTWLFKD